MSAFFKDMSSADIIVVAFSSTERGDKAQLMRWRFVQNTCEINEYLKRITKFRVHINLNLKSDWTHSDWWKLVMKTYLMMDQLHDWHQDNNTAHWTDCKSHVFIHIKLKIASTWGLICNPRLMDAQKQWRLNVIGFNLHFINWLKKTCLISTFVIF